MPPVHAEMVCFRERNACVGVREVRNRTDHNMKRNVIAGLVVAALVCGGSIGTVMAQSGPGQGQGKGYGGPPQSQEERAARQANCPQKNGGVCPNGGPRQDCPAFGQGNGNGQGKGYGRGNGQGRGARNGLRDGTGPRAQAGACPNVPAK